VICLMRVDANIAARRQNREIQKVVSTAIRPRAGAVEEDGANPRVRDHRFKSQRVKAEVLSLAHGFLTANLIRPARGDCPCLPGRLPSRSAAAAKPERREWH